VAKQEIMALSQITEQINSKFSNQQQRNSQIIQNGVKSSNESVDLDNLFAFLSEVTPNGNNSNEIINEIGEKMNNLVEDLDVELESVIQQEIEGLTNEKNLAMTQAAQQQPKKTPPPPPQKPQTLPNLVQNQPQQNNNHVSQAPQPPQNMQLIAQAQQILQQQQLLQQQQVINQQNKMGLV
jgi:hypothetical protein